MFHSFAIGYQCGNESRIEVVGSGYQRHPLKIAVKTVAIGCYGGSKVGQGVEHTSHGHSPCIEVAALQFE